MSTSLELPTEMLAWYKYVKGLKPQQKAPLLHSCYLTAGRTHPHLCVAATPTDFSEYPYLPTSPHSQFPLHLPPLSPLPIPLLSSPLLPCPHTEKQLLSRAIPLSAEFQLKWSSTELTDPPIHPQDVILQFSDPKPSFWAPVYMDQQPFIEVEFRENHIITAVEIRGICLLCITSIGRLWAIPSCPVFLHYCDLRNAWNATCGCYDVSGKTSKPVLSFLL